MSNGSGTGISIFLIAVGAILYFAVSKSVNGLSLDAVGIILMIVGGLGLIISVVMLGTARARGGRTTVVQGTTPVRRSTTVVQEDLR
ncbi:MAG: DUF6458 family protein [Actinomycetota bacterium]|nr:DUF6458 family protein [Actinomycetota bacterium]MDQ6947636.1 DUF6458 family protein [Actinomycetota bacterium]